MEDDNNNCLKFVETEIQSLDLPELKKIKPVFNCKHKKETRNLEKLEKEKNELHITLSKLQMQKNQLEKLLIKKNQIYEKVEIRGNKAQKELSKAKIMCPIYQVQMNLFIEKIFSVNNEPKPKEYRDEENWLQLEGSLIEQKENLEQRIKANQNEIDDFVSKYLD